MKAAPRPALPINASSQTSRSLIEHVGALQLRASEDQPPMLHANRGYAGLDQRRVTPHTPQFTRLN